MPLRKSKTVARLGRMSESPPGLNERFEQLLEVIRGEAFHVVPYIAQEPSRVLARNFNKRDVSNYGDAPLVPCLSIKVLAPPQHSANHIRDAHKAFEAFVTVFLVAVEELKQEKGRLMQALQEANIEKLIVDLVEYGKGGSKTGEHIEVWVSKEKVR
ncbi:MAG: hypothetical protein U1C66_02270 [Patescibacteria group bacterium]|nr:hypothetical protein [Patescibacteria group bacterium]